MLPTSARAILLESPSNLSPELRDRLESRLFRHLLLRNGTYKTTASGRLVAIDQILLPRLPRHRPVSLMDVGLSSGVTTVDWIRQLDASHIHFQLTGVDLVLRGKLHTFPLGMEVLVDSAGFALQLAMGDRGICRPSRPVNALRARILESLFRVAERLVTTRAGGSDIVLATRELVADSRVELVERDIASENPEWVEGFDVVRVANVLNLAYFPAPVLREMARLVWRYVRIGGQLICVRTDDSGTHHATCFSKGERGEIIIVARLGDGADVEPLLLH